MAISKKCINLKTLDLSMVDGLTDKDLAAVFANARGRYHKIFLSSGIEITPASVVALSNSFSNLKELHVNPNLSSTTCPIEKRSFTGMAMMVFTNLYMQGCPLTYDDVICIAARTPNITNCRLGCHREKHSFF
eukprot:TRINITY_DN1004_c0_g4_i1.p1 TRINITY_DN1004_c0_g4~~TRINITY_DN1004_c0_g4_i1.p1  ORF type:complete len:133 (-),score=7.93 TRINITY_DN1004_c0_g4_i1:419-817(-)